MNISKLFCTISCLALSMVSLGASAASAAPAVKKHAIVAGDWGQAAYAASARAMGAQLAAAGWIVHVLDGTQTIEGGSWTELLTNAVKSDIAPGDQVLLDIQGNGSEGRGYMAVNDEAPGEDVEDQFGYVSYEDALQMQRYSSVLQYPYADREMFKEHWASAYVPNTSIHDLGAPQILSFTQNMRALGARVTIIDHSSSGGALVRLYDLDPWADPNVCAISTTGVMTPAIPGYPATESYLSRLNSLGTIHNHTMSSVADYISTSYYTPKKYHRSGNNLQSIGYRTGCSDTLALRETLSLADGAWGTLWNWDRQMPSHVARAPAHYASTTGASPDQPFVGADPRLAIGQGWVRWNLDAVNKFYVEHQLATYVVSQYSSLYSSTLTVPNIFAYGVAVNNGVLTQKSLVDRLNRDILYKKSFYGSPLMSADEYLRDTLVKTCLCPYQNTDALRNTNLNCSGPVFLPPSYQKKPQQLCARPAGLVNLVAGGVPGMGTEVSGLKDASKSIRDSAVLLSDELRAFESTCVSSACSGQSL